MVVVVVAVAVVLSSSSSSSSSSGSGSGSTRGSIVVGQSSRREHYHPKYELTTLHDAITP